MLGLSDTSILSRWEHGLTVPNLGQVFLLSRIYSTLPHELFDSLWNNVGLEYNLLTQHHEPVINQSI